MKHVYLALNWLFGILFIIVGIVILIKSPLAGLSLIGVSLLLLPPVKNFAYEKTNKTFPTEVKVVVIAILLIAFAVFMGQSQEKLPQEQVIKQDKELAEKREEIRQKDIDYFNANREEIVLSAKKALLSKEYQLVISQSTRYLVSNDTELKKVHSSAKTEILLAELRSIPVKEYEKNKILYQQLVQLHPENNKYKSKVNFYENKIIEKKQKHLAVKERKKRIENQFSSWDGSHRNLERFIKKAMNDPESYEHDETSYWDKGSYLIVKTTYRGKNAFGGIVRNFVKAKVSIDGQILQIIDQT